MARLVGPSNGKYVGTIWERRSGPGFDFVPLPRLWIECRAAEPAHDVNELAQIVGEITVAGKEYHLVTNRELERAGFAGPSPYLSVILGLGLMYAVFALPFYVGSLVWLSVSVLGLGATVMGLRTYVESGRSRPA